MRSDRTRPVSLEANDVQVRLGHTAVMAGVSVGVGRGRRRGTRRRERPGYTIPSPPDEKVRVRASMQGYRPKEDTFTATCGAVSASNLFLDPE